MAIKYESNFVEGDFFPSGVVNNIIDSIKENEINIDKKIDKVDGKGLSTNDYTDAEKQKNADNAEKIELLTLNKTEFDEMYGEGVIPKDYKIYKAMTNFKAKGDTTSTLNSGVEWYTNGWAIHGVNRSLNEDGSPINYNLYDGTNVKITYGSKNVTVKIFDISVEKFTGMLGNWGPSFSDSTLIACSLDSDVTESLNLPTDVEGSVKNTRVSIEFVDDTNKLQIKKNDFIRHTTHGWDLISRIVDIDNELIDYIKNTDYASEDKAGVVKVGISKGIGISPLDQELYVNTLTTTDIINRTNTIGVLPMSFLNTIVKAALTDSKRISNMTETEKENARDVIGAEKMTKIAVETTSNVVLNDKVDTRVSSSVTTINLTIPTLVTPLYESAFSFQSGETATTLTYPGDTIKFVGVDCDESGDFVTTANKNYEVIIKNLSTNMETPVLVARVGVY